MLLGTFNPLLLLLAPIGVVILGAMTLANLTTLVKLVATYDHSSWLCGGRCLLILSSFLLVCVL